MAHFDDVILPDNIAFGSRSGPGTSVQVVFSGSGYRKTNNRWGQKLRTLQVGYAIRSPRDAYTIQRIFEAVDGPANSFLAKDWSDWNSTDGYMDERLGSSMITALDQPLKNTVDDSYYGDGSTQTFQMVKLYTVGTAQHERTIKKPISGTVKIGQGGVEIGSGFSVDYSTGIVTFTAAPAAGSPVGEEVNWGGKFYMPVAFVTDRLLIEQSVYDGNSIPDIELIEERL